ncbi:hypothetical protein HMPREF9182_1355 [Streptococcus sp. oral taxon 056 str. F0418]|nr:hypothetical protein HMPREF9182_1355 [Streptococcus sp. oral taxon 056 str. F0418]
MLQDKLIFFTKFLARTQIRYKAREEQSKIRKLEQFVYKQANLSILHSS